MLPSALVSTYVPADAYRSLPRMLLLPLPLPLPLMLLPSLSLLSPWVAPPVVCLLQVKEVSSHLDDAMRVQAAAVPADLEGHLVIIGAHPRLQYYVTAMRRQRPDAAIVVVTPDKVRSFRLLLLSVLGGNSRPLSFFFFPCSHASGGCARKSLSVRLLVLWVWPEAWNASAVGRVFWGLGRRCSPMLSLCSAPPLMWATSLRFVQAVCTATTSEEKEPTIYSATPEFAPSLQLSGGSVVRGTRDLGIIPALFAPVRPGYIPNSPAGQG